eukprot:3872027-Pyramimonas_sp.AAC.1
MPPPCGGWTPAPRRPRKHGSFAGRRPPSLPSGLARGTRLAGTVCRTPAPAPASAAATPATVDQSCQSAHTPGQSARIHPAGVTRSSHRTLRGTRRSDTIITPHTPRDPQE